jgi:hypothetical protein
MKEREEMSTTVDGPSTKLIGTYDNKNRGKDRDFIYK